MTAGTSGITINDVGAIQSLIIPENWVESVPREAVGGRQLRQFHLAQRPDLRFCSYLRTLPLSRPASEAFQRVIYADFHKLSQDELDSLESVLEAMADASAFQILEASTGYINSRRVLSVQGQWLRMLEKTMICFLDVNGDGLYVQEIYFSAPPGRV